MARVKYVTLVTTDILTPYRKGEVFTVNAETAERLLRPNMERTDFGPRYPKVKVRLFDSERDQDLLLENRVLTEPEHLALLKELHPDDYADIMAKEAADSEDDEPVAGLDDDEPLTDLAAATVRRRRTAK